MTHQIPEGYHLVPIPSYEPPAKFPPSPPLKKTPPPFFALLAIAIILLLLNGEMGKSNGNNCLALKRQNAQIQQENLFLRNQIDQLQYTLMGVYSAPQR